MKLYVSLVILMGVPSPVVERPIVPPTRTALPWRCIWSRTREPPDPWSSSRDQHHRRIGILPRRTPTDGDPFGIHEREWKRPVPPTISTSSLASVDCDRLRTFAAAHPEASFLGIRFESTPPGPEKGGGASRGAVIVQVFKISDLTQDGRIRFNRSTSDEANALARRLVGR